MAWVGSLSGVDAWALWTIAVAAAFYLAALLATGSQLFLLVFPELPLEERYAAGRLGGAAGLLALLLVLAQWLLQAAYLGGELVAAFDPMLLGMVFDGAQGTRLLLTVAGLLLLVLGLLGLRRVPPAVGYGLGLLGVLLVVIGFVLVGHTVSEPRLPLAGLLLIHLLGAAFWVGALIPLYRLAGRPTGDPEAGSILDRFGRVAMGVVGLLVLAGLVLATWLSGGIPSLLTTAHGQFLLLKVLLVGVVLLFAATHKWRLVPAFVRGEPGAARRLRRSIAVESGFIGAVIVVTAVLTTVSSPAGVS